MERRKLDSSHSHPILLYILASKKTLVEEPVNLLRVCSSLPPFLLRSLVL